MVKNLKLISLFCLLSFVGVTLQAQTVMTGTAKTDGFQVKDQGFENWSQSFDGAPALGGGSTGSNTGKGLWYGANVYKSVSGINVYGQVVYQTTDAHGGTYAAKLQDTEVGALGITEVSPSWVTLGTPWAYLEGIKTGTATAGTDGGIKFTARPDTMAVWIKRVSEGTEHINLVYYSWTGTSMASSYKNKDGGCTSTTHYDEESDIRFTKDPNTCGTNVMAKQIGEGSIQTSNQYSKWTEIKVPIEYYNDDVPEKMNIILSASNYPEGRRNDGLVAGNYMIVDDLRFIYSSKVEEIRLGGKPYTEFSSDIYEYEYGLGDKATMDDIPAIKCKRNGRTLSDSEVEIELGDLGEFTTIKVKAEDGSSTSTYKIKFTRAKSKNSRPVAIYINGEKLAGFNGYLYNYDVELPYGTTGTPEITVDAADENQVVEVTTCEPTCSAKVKVTAHDGISVSEYTLNLSVGQLKDNTLKDILLDGQSLEGFKPNTNLYTVYLPADATEVPTIEAVSAYEEGLQKIEIVNNGLSAPSTIVVTPPAGTSRTYKIQFKIKQSTNSYLNSIMLDGVEISDFAPDKLNYDISLPIGTTSLPKITWVQGDEYQTVSLVEGSINGVSRITVTAQDGSVSLYRLSFSTQKSSNAKLNNIYLDGVALEGFNKDVFNYAYTVSSLATSRPVVTWEKGDEFQSVTKNPASELTSPISGETKLTVYAEDGSINIYVITFSQNISDNSKLASLSVAGAELSPAFSSDVYAYTCELERGTTSLPTITYTKGDETQTVRVVEGGVNGETKITVKAQSGAVTTYTIKFSVKVSSNADLAAINIGGNLIEGFDPKTLEYNYSLPSGTTTLPQITTEKGDYAQTVYTVNGGVNGTTQIIVVAEDGTTQTYLIHFSVEKSANALLKNIYLNGVALEGFDPEVFSYTYVITEDMTSAPLISTESYDGQSINITQPKLYGLARIEVKPEVGNSNVYTILFTTPLSDDNKLSSIEIDGNQLEGFDPAVNTYQVELEEGTTTMPSITYTKGDDTQTVELVNAGLNSNSVIYVVAENGSVNVYTIQFSVKKSESAALKNIFIDDVALEGFNPENAYYKVTLPLGTTSLPELTVEKGSVNQVVQISKPLLNGLTNINVYSASGTMMFEYIVEFAVEKSSVSTLADITVNGESLEGFSPEITDYTLDVYYGNLPVISYVKGDDKQFVANSVVDETGMEFVVTAENGDTKNYNITFNIISSNDAELSNIVIYNSISREYEPLQGFASDKYEYEVELPWRTEMLPPMLPVGRDEQQVISVEEGGVNGVTIISVLAGDKQATNEYKITFSTKKSDVAALSMIYVQDVEFEFDPEVTDYIVELPYGTTSVPFISYAKAKANDDSEIWEQKVQVEYNGIYSASKVKVTAEDGTERVYSINFKVAESDKENVLTGVSYLVNDELVTIPFESGKYEYTVVLPYGTTVVPELIVNKSYPEQTYSASQSMFGKQTIIDVYSNKADNEKVTYKVIFEVEKNLAVLSGIALPESSTLYPAFSEDIKEYVAVISLDKSNSDIIFNTESYNSIEKTTDASNYIELSVTNTNNTNMNSIYKVYIHYAEDSIPNNDFTDWETATYNNAAKPIGWNVPSEYVENYKKGLGTMEFSKAVQKTSTAGEVKLYTYSPIGSGGIGGPFPGMMTLGTMNITLKDANGSTASISGGIPFRNTPDKVNFRYKFTNKSKVDNLRFVYTLSDGTNEYSKVFEDGTISNDYVEKSLEVLNTDVYFPTTLNLTLNSADSENPSSLSDPSWFGSSDYSTLYVDWVNFSYTSTISGIKVNDVDATENNLNGYIFYTVTIPDSYKLVPELDITGDVSDQSYSVVWKAGYRNATITSYAEDGSSTSYDLIVTREDNLALTNLFVDGAALAEFDANKFEYTIYRNNGDRRMPDVMAQASSYNQNIVIYNTVNKSEIIVTAESGATLTYVINFVESKSSDATLKSLSVEGYDIAFSSDVNDYTVTLPADATNMPAINYEKLSDGQSVVLTEGGVNGTTTVKVIAEDGNAEAANVYSIIFKTEIPVVNTTLSEIAVENGELVPAFSPDVYEYTCNTPLGEQVAVYYTVADKNAKLEINLGEYSITWSLVPNPQSQLRSAAVPTVYTMTFARELSSNTDLKDITINGVSLDGFHASVKDYTYHLDLGENLEIVALPVEETQIVDVSFDNSTLTYSFLVTAENGDTQTYTLKLEYNKSIDATLSTILIDGVQLERFSPEKLDYEYEIPASDPKLVDPAMPLVEAFANANAQVIDIEYNGVHGTTFITVQSESGAEKTYSITFSVEKSSNSLLKNISVNYVTIPGYMPEVKDYTVVMSSTSAQPVITYEKYDAYQTVEEITELGVTKLKVTAEDGTVSVYEIKFEAEYNRNTRLEDILVDGVSLDGFNPEVFSYKYELPVGTTELPEILVISAVEGQTLTVEEGGVNGVTLITVKADDNISSATYIINFSVKLSDVDYLLDIQSAGASLAGFASDKYEYTMELPVGETNLPIVTWVPGDEFQTVDTLSINKDKWNTEVRFNVKSQSGLSNVYKVNYQTLKSSDATLKAILVDEAPIEGFEPNVFDYVVELPVGTTEFPEVSYEGADDYQVVNKLVANEKLNIFNVTAEDGTTNTYKVEFTVKLSENVELSSIELDGIPLRDFEPTKLEYTYVLENGVESHPVVNPIPMDDYQKIEVDDSGVFGDYKIYVTAQNGNRQVYVIHFGVEKSKDATLTDILADGESIPNYDSEIFDYTVILPYGSTRVPIVTYVSPNPKLQTITVSQAKSLTDTTTIVVVAEEETISNTYRIAYKVEESSNASLGGIYLDGTLLEGFDNDNAEYYVSLPYGTENLPEVTVVQGDEDQNVTITTEGLETSVLVVSQNGLNMSEFVIYYTIDKNSENRLKSLLWKGKKISDFDPLVGEYLISFPAGTEPDAFPKVEEITYEVFDSTEVVTVSESNGNIIVTVVAENGDIRIYAIASEVLLSDDTHLEGIYIDGVLIKDFDPDQLEYVYKLPFGTVVAPTDITYIAGSDKQEVIIAENPITEPTQIFVTAEDGTTVEYRIHYEVSTFNPTTIPTENNVCITSLPGGKWRFTTDCNMVNIMLSTLDGKVFFNEKIDLVNPNCYDLCSEDAEGVVYAPVDDRVIVYFFVYNNKTIIKGGKFRSIKPE